MEYNWIYILLSFVLSALSGLIIIPQIMKFCLKRGLFDLPNARKVHHVAVPRLGGTAFIPCMFIAFTASLCVLYCNSGTTQVSISLWTGIFMVSLFMIYVVGTVDDLIGLNAMVKFLVQIAAASLLPLSGLYINDLYGLFGINEIPFWVGAPLTVFIIVFIDNSMNLIDGIDGLAGGLALISLTGFLLCFAREQVWTYCVLIAGLMGVLTSYLYFNIWGKPERGQKIFMGDSGSLTLGFILGFLMVKFAMNSSVVMPYRSDGLLLSYTLLIVPCFDVVRVVLVRLRIGQPIFQADKRHIHHKLMRCGLNQHQTLVVILLLQIVYVVMNTMLGSHVPITYIALIDIVLYATFHLTIDARLAQCKKKAA